MNEEDRFRMYDIIEEQSRKSERKELISEFLEDLKKIHSGQRLHYIIEKWRRNYEAY